MYTISISPYGRWSDYLELDVEGNLDSLIIKTHAQKIQQ